jgi:transposase
VTSTYFESDPPFPEGDKRKYGYSRDKRFDCVQVVIALIVTPEGFPLAYEVMAGNTADHTTLSVFLKRIEAQYGKAERIWVRDRGIPTEAVLQQMRQSDPPVSYLVGTPKGRLTRYEKALTEISLGIRFGRGCRSSCCPKTTRFMGWRRVGTGSIRNGP